MTLSIRGFPLLDHRFIIRPEHFSIHSEHIYAYSRVLLELSPQNAI